MRIVPDPGAGRHILRRELRGQAAREKQAAQNGNGNNVLHFFIRVKTLFFAPYPQPSMKYSGKFP